MVRTVTDYAIIFFTENRVDEGMFTDQEIGAALNLMHRNLHVTRRGHDMYHKLMDAYDESEYLDDGEVMNERSGVARRRAERRQRRERRE